MAGASKRMAWSNDGDGIPSLANEELPVGKENEKSSTVEADEAGSQSKETRNSMSDMDFLRSKQTVDDHLSDSDESDVPLPAGKNHSDQAPRSLDNNNSPKASSKPDKEESEAFEQDEGRTKSRLFVRNIPFNSTEDDLRAYFEPYGKLLECHVPVDDRNRHKGFAFVHFVSPADAHCAMKDLDQKDFQGRVLSITPAKSQPSRVADSIDHMQSYKKRRELDRKAEESNARNAKGWSASYVRSDAVVESLAERLGITKGAFLSVKDDLDSGDAAVRIAMAETQIIEENRTYFKEHGIDMDSLVSSSADDKIKSRSQVSVLVKNLPFDTTSEELLKLFHMGNDEVEVLLPPSRTIALIRYGNPSDARKAFRKLAYKKFKHVPIYLEWAPIAAEMSQTASGASSTTDQPRAQNERQDGEDIGQPNDVEDPDPHLTATVYVRNLNFNTSESALADRVEREVGKVLSVRIPRRVAANNGESTSMGYGFVELESLQTAKSAIKRLQGKILDGHALQLEVSKSKTSSSEIRPTSSKNPTKILVRNVPFQATRSELLKLFGSFGHLRRVRLPKKFDGSHRGFAFVEYATSKEAQNGMKALSRTHLYGRRLVLEWAEDDETLVAKD